MHIPILVPKLCTFCGHGCKGGQAGGCGRVGKWVGMGGKMCRNACEGGQPGMGVRGDVWVWVGV